MPDEQASGSRSPVGSRAVVRGIGTGWGPTAAQITRAGRLVDGLTLRELAGQVIVAAYHGTSAPTGFVDDLHLGGVVLFDENVVTPTQLRRSNRVLQRSAAASGRSWPVLIGVDQEGGRVARVRTGLTGFPTFMTAGAARRPELTRAAYAASGGELAGLGFTVDFAPDADVTIGASDPTIGARSAGSRPVRVANQVVAAIAGFASTGLVPVLKHFPGHGSVTANSHYTLPVQERSLATLQRRDLVPFRVAVERGAPAVMVAHLDVRAVDPGVPSSLSKPVVTGLLRRQLGFQGLAVTDSLSMLAVADRFGSAGAAVRALRAGEDVLLMPSSPREARDGIVAAVRDGRLARARVEQAATRQVALLLHQRAGGLTSRPPASSGRESRRLSAAGLTLVQGACTGRLVGEAVSVSGSPVAVSAFRDAAGAAGLPVLASGGTTVRLLGVGDSAYGADVAVALDTPYVLGRVRAPVKIATYGETPGAMRALVSVLLGRARAPGRLPVRVPRIPRTGC